MAFFFNRYPYTDFHELNLDWIISKIKEVKDAVKAADESAKAASDSEEAAGASADAAAGSAEAAGASADAAAESAETAAEILESLDDYNDIANVINYINKHVVMVSSNFPTCQSMTFYGDYIIQLTPSVLRVLDKSTFSQLYSYNTFTLGHPNCCQIIDKVLYANDYSTFTIHRFNIQNVAAITQMADITLVNPNAGGFGNEFFICKQYAGNQTTLFAALKNGHNSNHFSVYQLFDDVNYSAYSSKSFINKGYLVANYTSPLKYGTVGQDTETLGNIYQSGTYNMLQAAISCDDSKTKQYITISNPIKNIAIGTLFLTGYDEPEGLAYDSTNDILYFTNTGGNLYKIESFMSLVDVLTDSTYKVSLNGQNDLSCFATILEVDTTNNILFIAKPWGSTYTSVHKFNSNNPYDPPTMLYGNDRSYGLVGQHVTAGGIWTHVRLNFYIANTGNMAIPTQSGYAFKANGSTVTNTQTMASIVADSSYANAIENIKNMENVRFSIGSVYAG